MRRFSVALILTVSLGLAFAAPKESLKLDYPDAQRGEVVDDYHGTQVKDPYRWASG